MTEATDDIHPRLVELMSRMEVDRVTGDFDFVGYKDEIVGLHSQLPHEADRVQCIVLYGMLINFGCDNISRNGGDPEALRNVAKAEHNLFLIKEAMDADGNVNPDEMARVTRREIESGRMEPDDNMAKLADAGSNILGSGAQPENKPGFWKRLFG